VSNNRPVLKSDISPSLMLMVLNAAVVCWRCSSHAIGLRAAWRHDDVRGGQVVVKGRGLRRSVTRVSVAYKYGHGDAARPRRITHWWWWWWWWWWLWCNAAWFAASDCRFLRLVSMILEPNLHLQANAQTSNHHWQHFTFFCLTAR